MTITIISDTLRGNPGMGFHPKLQNESWTWSIDSGDKLKVRIHSSWIINIQSFMRYKYSKRQLIQPRFIKNRFIRPLFSVPFMLITLHQISPNNETKNGRPQVILLTDVYCRWIEFPLSGMSGWEKRVLERSASSSSIIGGDPFIENAGHETQTQPG